MPLLDNPKHEIFAQQLAQGKTADEAYALAGYRKSRSNASVLRTNQSISDRVTELQYAASARTAITIESLIREHFDLRPGAIIRDLDLRRPIYRKTAAFGHFGRTEETFSWEATDKAAELRQGAPIAEAVAQ
jgi:hypothetical protein